MSIQAIGTKVVSTLGNKESLIPIIVKDGVDSLSLTCKSFKEGGKVEGMERAIDEFGTQAIWIGGIPFFKKLIDSTVYRVSKINPAVDPRIIANEEYANWALKNAEGIMSNTKSQSVKKAISDCLLDNGKKAKNLFKGKIAIATGLTLGTYFLLTKSKQKNTENTVLNNIKTTTEYDLLKTMDSEVFKDIIKQKNVSFAGGKNIMEAIMFNPVHNMKIIDAGITTERLACSRNKTEFMEHAIKEGGFLFFVYGFGNLIEQGINKFSDKFLKQPIDLNIDVIMDKNFEKCLNKKNIAKQVDEFKKVGDVLTDKLTFLKNNPENIFVQSAKKSGLIKTVKNELGEHVLDTSKYIDMKELDVLAKNLVNIEEKFSNNKQGINNFIKKTKCLKVLSVVSNIGISCLFLGYLIPKAIYAYRKNETGTTKFHVEENIKSANLKKA